jgi:hypothetical protein
MNSFQRLGYTKVENLIDADTIKIVSKYFENKLRRGEWVSPDKLPEVGTPVS